MSQTFRYGSTEDQVGDLYLPDGPRPGVVCLLHGGFWRTPHSRAEMADIAQDLVGHGFAVWNLEYRRIGDKGGGWPGTFQDVAAGVDHLATLAQDGVPLDLGCVIMVGHSAGGQLALWSARPTCTHDVVLPPRRVTVAAVAGLAPVADLARAHDLALGRGAVADFLDGSPVEQPERYRAASPISMLPLDVQQLVVHGALDAVVPIAATKHYVRQAMAAGDRIKFVELADAEHMDFLRPTSEAHAALRDWLSDVWAKRAGKASTALGGRD